MKKNKNTDFYIPKEYKEGYLNGSLTCEDYSNIRATLESKENELKYAFECNFINYMLKSKKILIPFGVGVSLVLALGLYTANEGIYKASENIGYEIAYWGLSGSAVGAVVSVGYLSLAARIIAIKNYNKVYNDVITKDLISKANKLLIEAEKLNYFEKEKDISILKSIIEYFASQETTPENNIKYLNLLVEIDEKVKKLSPEYLESERESIISLRLINNN